MFKFFKKIKKAKKDQRGITLVIAITTMTLLLSISLSISNIVLRQIRITNINNLSKPAFFVADSGIECAFYYDTTVLFEETLDLDLNTDFSNSIFGQLDNEISENRIRCGEGSDFKVLSFNKTEISQTPQTFLTTFDIDYGDMCAKVEVTRTEVNTKINSYGYNTKATSEGCDLSDVNVRRLVERGLTINY